MTSNSSQVVVMAASLNRISSTRSQHPTKYRGGAIKLPSTSRFFDSESQLKITTSNASLSNTNNITRSDLRKIFDKFDHNKTGLLNLCQFSSLCYCLIDHKKLINIDIPSVYEIIDDDASNGISFDEFCKFIEPTTMLNNDQTSMTPSAPSKSGEKDHNNHLSEAFATTYIGNSTAVNDKYPSPTPPPTKFDTDYVSRFWARDMGVQLTQGINGINAYVKWRFTDHARNHISSGSKIIAINGKNVDGATFEEITNFLNIVIITKVCLVYRYIYIDSVYKQFMFIYD